MRFSRDRKLVLQCPQDHLPELTKLLNDERISTESIADVELKSTTEVVSAVAVVVGTSAFWVSLASVLRSFMSRSQVEVWYQDSETKYKLKGQPVEIERVLATLRKTVSESTGDEDEAS